MEFSRRTQQLSDSLTLKINAKANLLRAQGIDIINLSAGEPDFDTPAIIKLRAKEAIDQGYTKYTPVSGITPLKQQIVARYSDQFGISMNEECVMVSSGAKQALYNIIETLCDPDDEVIIPVPYWVSYPEIVKLCPAVPHLVDTAKTNFLLTPDTLAHAINDRTKLIILNSPCNPTGIVYPRALLNELVTLVKQRNIFCIADEIYDELVYDDLHPQTILSGLESPFSNIAVVNGFSKAFSMTGWRLGYLIASPMIIKQASKVQSHTTSCPSSISQYAAMAAYREARPCIELMRKAFNKRRDLAVQLLREIDGISFPVPHGAFYVFFDVSGFYTKTINSSVAFAEYLLENHHVAIVPGAAFGDDRCLRLSFALSLDKLKEGISRVRKGLMDVRG
jgi:aspartate aminotransferase